MVLVDYQIIFSSRKTLCAEVKIGGQIIIRAPHGTSKNKIQKFIKEHELWLVSAKERQINRAKSKYHQTLSENDILL